MYNYRRAQCCCRTYPADPSSLQPLYVSSCGQHFCYAPWFGRHFHADNIPVPSRISLSLSICVPDGKLFIPPFAHPQPKNLMKFLWLNGLDSIASLKPSGSSGNPTCPHPPRQSNVRIMKSSHETQRGPRGNCSKIGTSDRATDHPTGRCLHREASDASVTYCAYVPFFSPAPKLTLHERFLQPKNGNNSCHAFSHGGR